jgi:hypothetical protein
LGDSTMPVKTLLRRDSIVGMTTAEAQLELMAPAIPFMWNVERMYRDVEEGRATLEQIEPWVRVTNSKIEALISSEDLQKFIRPGIRQDRYRMMHFAPLCQDSAHSLPEHPAVS